MFQFPVTYRCLFPSEEKYRRHILRDLAAAGVANIVLSEEMIKQVITDFGFADTLKKELADAGLNFLDAHAPFGYMLDMACPYPAQRPQMIALQKLTLEICAYMGVDTITIHLGNNHFKPACDYSDEQLIDWMKETLSELLPVAERLGITICIENIWFSVNTPEVLNSIKACFPTDALGFCYDSGHANLMAKGHASDTSFPRVHWASGGRGEPLWDDKILEKMLPHVVNCHLHDNYGVGDEHNIIGDGSIDWEHIMPLLLSAPRLKVIQSEFCPISRGVAFAEMVSRVEGLMKLKDR